MKNLCFRRLPAFLLALLLCAAMTACGRTRGGISARVGVLRGDASSEEALAWERYLRDLCGKMGVSIDFSTALESADAELSAIQRYASLGYNGIIAMTSYNPTNILKKCQDYGMYLVFGAAHPDFENSQNTLSKDESVIITDYAPYPYYVGAVGPSNYGEVLAGRQMGRAAVEKGYTNFSVFTGSAAYGQPMHALRIAGFFLALRETDPTVTYQGIACTEENWKPLALAIEKNLGISLPAFSSERFRILSQTGGYSFYQGDTAAVAAVAYLSSVPGVECVFCAGSADGISSFAPPGSTCVYVGNDSLGNTFRNLFDEGKLIFDVAKYNSFSGPAFALLLKSIYRDEAVRVNGQPVSVEQGSLQITGSADYDVIDRAESREGGYFFSAEFLSAYLLETALGEPAAGYEKITDAAFVEITGRESTLGEGSLYEATQAVSRAFTTGGHDIFQFSGEAGDSGGDGGNGSGGSDSTGGGSGSETDGGSLGGESSGTGAAR